MAMRILVTGGAGLIGSHIVDQLIEVGHQVTILDNLAKEVHHGKIPDYLNPKARFLKGTVTKPVDIADALKGIDAVYHEAATLGIGLSMYQIRRFVLNNCLGTANLLDFLANHKHQVRRLIVASSVSAFGEGLYQCAVCGKVRPPTRDDVQMEKKDWEVRCPHCHKILTPIPLPETESFFPTSIYAITKQSQEEMMMVFGKAYKIPVTAFRYYNVYGPRQSLSNPYSGVLAIFLSRLKNNYPPVIYEDGLQSRDFVSVHDVAKANVLALENSATFNQVFNLGTGKNHSIKEVAETLARLLKKEPLPEITYRYRSGDTRHCFADMRKTKKIFKWQPEWTLKKGLADLIAWGEGKQAKDTVGQAIGKLQKKGLMKKITI